MGDYFNIPRTSLILVALVVAVAALWGSYLTVICQGLGWFQRLALIGLLTAVVRVLFRSGHHQNLAGSRVGRFGIRR